MEVRDFEMKVTGVYGGDAMKRQVAEAVTIQHAHGAGLLNRHDEWRQINCHELLGTSDVPVMSRHPARHGVRAGAGVNSSENQSHEGPDSWTHVSHC